MLKYVFAFFAFFFITEVVFAGEIQEVTATGTGLSKPLALKDALKNALEKVSGTVMSSNTIMVNGKIVGDKSAAYSAGYVKKYEVISETPEPPYFTITIKASVAFDEIPESDTGSSSGEFDLKAHKALESSKEDSQKSLERILETEIPRIIEGFDSCVRFRLENVAMNNPFKADIHRWTDKVCFESQKAGLSTFLNRLGINNYTAINETVDKYYKKKGYKNIVFALKDDKGKYLDVYKIDNYKVSFNLNENDLKVYAFEGNIEDKVISKTSKLSAELSYEKDYGYTLGIRAGEPSASEADKGITVIGVSSGSPAQEVGIKGGDRIYSINGQQVKSLKNALNILQNIASPNASIGIRRGEKTFEVKTILKRRYNKMNKDI